MDCENCEAKNGRAPFIMVPMVALFAAVLGIGSCAKHRRHSHQHEGPEGHERHVHPRHHECCCSNERHVHPDHGPVKVRIEPLQILEKRFAGGEIDEDEFRRRRNVLQENAQ